jgi:membrane protein required for colicin V production
VAGITTVMGFWKGLTSQVFGLAGLICGYILSTRYYLKVAGLLPDINQGTAKIIGFLSIFVAFIIIAYFLGRFVSKILKIAGLGWANRLLGGALGLLKGTLIVTIVLVVLMAFMPSGNDFMKASITIPYIVSASKIIGAAIPDDIKARYKSRLELLDLLKKKQTGK